MCVCVAITDLGGKTWFRSLSRAVCVPPPPRNGPEPDDSACALILRRSASQNRDAARRGAIALSLSSLCVGKQGAMTAGGSGASGRTNRAALAAAAGSRLRRRQWHACMNVAAAAAAAMYGWGGGALPAARVRAQRAGSKERPASGPSSEHSFMSGEKGEQWGGVGVWARRRKKTSGRVIAGARARPRSADKAGAARRAGRKAPAADRRRVGAGKGAPRRTPMPANKGTRETLRNATRARAHTHSTHTHACMCVCVCEREGGRRSAKE